MANSETKVFLTNPADIKVLKSRNGINGDSENSLMISTKKVMKKRRSVYPLCATLMGLVFAVWLIGLTMIREFQLSALRKDVELLKLDIDDIKKQMLEDKRLMDELKVFETLVKAEENNYTYPNYMNFFQGDDDDDDDDDDWSDDSIDDFDQSEDNFDRSKSIDLTDDAFEDDGQDFLGDIMEAHTGQKSHPDYADTQPPMKKIMRISKESMDDDSKNRSKRDIVAETPDGVPILDEPYHVAKAKNYSQHVTPVEQGVQFIKGEHNKHLFSGWDSDQKNHNHHRRKHMKKYEQFLSSTASPALVFTRPSRVMVTEENQLKPLRKMYRRPITKSGPAGNHDTSATGRQSDEVEVFRMRRRRKNRPGVRRNMDMSDDVETFAGSVRSKELLAVHYDGNTSDFEIGRHEHYDGNGRLRHAYDTPYTSWSPSSWTKLLGTDEQFPIRNGAISVPESGVYFIYVQIFYHDEHDTNGFEVFRNNGRDDEVILQCTTMTHTQNNIVKSNTCYTAGIFMLETGDNISIKNTGSLRYSLMMPGKSFFGLMKLADTRGRR